MPETDQRIIHAWAAHVTVAPARSHGLSSVRRAMKWNDTTAASVAIAPSAFATSRPSAPSLMPSAISAIHSGLVQP